MQKMELNIKKYGVLRNKLRIAKENHNLSLCYDIQHEMESLAKTDEDLTLYEKEFGDKPVKSKSQRGREISQMIFESELVDAYNVCSLSLDDYISLIDNIDDDSFQKIRLCKYFKIRFGKSIEIVRLEKEYGCSVDSSNFPIDVLLAKSSECERIFDRYSDNNVRLAVKASSAKDEYVKAYAQVKGISEDEAYQEHFRYCEKDKSSTIKETTTTMPKVIDSNFTSRPLVHSVYYGTGYIMVIEAKSEIEINKRKYPFSKILNFKVNDNPTIIQSPASYETKKSTSSMLGRALIGGILTGGVGAIVGAATAKSMTVQTAAVDSTTHHNYTIIINIDDISNPTEILEIKDSRSQQKVEEISGILNVIINNNKQKNILTPPVVHTQTNNTIADELIKLAELKKQGILTEEEFNHQKAKLLRS